MKSLILYALPVGTVPDISLPSVLGRGYSAIQPYSKVKGQPADTVFVRAELVDGGVDAALDKARPRGGETVLNTIPHTD